MKAQAFTIAQEDLVIFERIADFKAFFEMTLKTPRGFSLESWSDALKSYEENNIHQEFYALFSFHDYFMVYDNICKSLDNFKRRGTFSKKMKKIFERDLDGFYSYEDFKNYITDVVTAVREQKDAAHTGCGPVVQKLIEYQRENEKEIKVPFYKRVFLLKPCGWALLVAAVFLYVMKVH